MKVSILIPTYQSGLTLPGVVGSLIQVAGDQQWDWEIVLVDDGSPDEQTWPAVLRLVETGKGRVKAYRLARNCGQHVALLCSLQHAEGDILVTMDDDGQNSPRDVPALVAAVAAGADLAVGSYEKKHHPAWRNLGGQFIDFLLGRIFSLPADFQLTSFRAFRRPVAEDILRAAGRNPYFTALALAQSSIRVNVPVAHAPRAAGSSHYTLRRSLRLACDLIFGYSNIPVYLVAALAVCCMLLAAGISIWALFRALWVGTGVPGWASLMVASSFFQGIVLFCLAIYGIYLSRLSREHTTPRRPRAVAAKWPL